MWTMSSARDSNWSPQPPNLQELEKKEAAAMPVIALRRWCTHRVKKRGGNGGGGGRVFGLTGEGVGAPLER